MYEGSTYFSSKKSTLGYLEDQELHSGLLTSWIFQGSISSPKDLELLRAFLGSRVSSQALANPHLYSCVAILSVLPSLPWTHRGSLGERWKARTRCLITQYRETWKLLVRTQYGWELKVVAPWGQEPRTQAPDNPSSTRENVYPGRVLSFKAL